MNTAHSILYEPHARLRSLLPDLSADWEQLADWCLAKFAEQRCASMDQVIDPLRRIASPRLRPEKSIAVLYFANLSGDREDEYFRDGMTEDIGTHLGLKNDTACSTKQSRRNHPAGSPNVGRQLQDTETGYGWKVAIIRKKSLAAGCQCRYNLERIRRLDSRCGS